MFRLAVDGILLAAGVAMFYNALWNTFGFRAANFPQEKSRQIHRQVAFDNAIGNVSAHGRHADKGTALTHHEKRGLLRYRPRTHCSPPPASSWLSIQAASPRPSGKARHRLSGQKESDLRPWMLL